MASSARRDATAALAAGADAPRRTAFAVALSGLDRAAASGRAFDRELAAATAQADMEIVGLLAPLHEHAPHGVETLTTLSQQFEGLARTAMKVDAMPADAPWYEKLWARLKSIVTVRPVGEVAGNSTGAIISRAEAQLARGDLESAVGTLGALDGAAALTFDKWVQRAQDRLAVDQVMARVALTAQSQAMAVVKPAPAPLAEEVIEEAAPTGQVDQAPAPLADEDTL
ncbi:MAG: COG4223 family protein [Alphaproteobacteria bacterium]